MAKLPSFSFYPGDWLRNDVAGCSLEAQGLWLRMMIVMHDAEVYGELSIKGEAMPDEFIAKKCGISRKKYQKFVKNLEDFCVINRKENGVIYSGRMVRDEAKRQSNAARQRDFYDKHERKPNTKPNAVPNTPFSSSSSSSSKKEELREEKESEADSKKKAAAPAKPKTPPKITLPENFSITDEMREWGKANTPNLSLDNHISEFIIFWIDIASKNNRRTLRGWQQTWRNRMTELQAKTPNGNGTHQKNNGNSYQPKPSPATTILNREYYNDPNEQAAGNGRSAG